MATYEQFLDALNRSKWAGEWSQSDLDLAKLHPEFGMSMLSYKDDWHNAATPEQRALANEGANEQRKLWGNYTGGADGRKFYSLGPQYLAADGLLEQAQEYGPFEYAREPEYRAALERVTGYDPFSYSREPDYQSALDSVLRYRDFSYDPETDPVYSAYRKTYAREGRRASEDTLGQYAAMTGGAPSTAAMTAAQQAGNYYSARMADKIPELYQQAYQRYLQEYQRQLQALDAIDADRRFSYGMYGDDYSRRMQALDALDADRRFDYGVYGDDFNRLMSRYGAVRDQENTEYDRSRQEDETAYRRDQDTLDRVRQNMLDLYGMDQDQLDRERQAMLDRYGMEQDAYANRLNAAKLGMSVGDYSGLGDLGITPDWNAVLNAELASQGRTVPVDSGGGGGSGGGSGGGTGGSPAKDTAQTETPTYATIAEELAAQGITTQSDAERYLKNKGATATEAKDWAQEYMAGLKNENGELVNHTNAYIGLDDDLQRMITRGASLEEITREINAALKNGSNSITQAEAEELKAKYGRLTDNVPNGTEKHGNGKPMSKAYRRIAANAGQEQDRNGDQAALAYIYEAVNNGEIHGYEIDPILDRLGL